MNKILSIFLLATLVLVSSTELAAQKKGKKKKSKTETVAVDTTSIGYNYGVLIGMGLQMQGIPSDSINAADVAAGLEKVLKGKMAPEDVDKAQEAFTQKVQELQNASEEARKSEEKGWFDANAKKNAKVKTLPSGMQYEILKEGTGAKPKPTSKVTTHYHGTLTDGKVFDSSVERGEPATFPVNGVIKGWQEILVMMPEGSKWKVYIPAALAYGNRAVGSIPANSILIFEIELLKIEG
jgi:FKBP-type peptidyl-prolyl cis-trans isomerase FklB